MDNKKSRFNIWEEFYSGRALGRFPPEELVRFMARNFGQAEDRSAVKVLELGSGSGANIWYLLHEGYSAAAIEGSASAIQITRDRLIEEGMAPLAETVDLRHGSFETLPWDDKSFDAVIDIEAVCTNPMAVIRSAVAEALRVLKPGGAFFGKMFGTETTGFGSGEVFEENTTRNPTEGPCAGFGTCHFFTENELRELFAPFASLDLNWVRRTDGETDLVHEWLITAHK